MHAVWSPHLRLLGGIGHHRQHQKHANLFLAWLLRCQEMIAHNTKKNLPPRVCSQRAAANRPAAFVLGADARVGAEIAVLPEALISRRSKSLPRDSPSLASAAISSSSFDAGALAGCFSGARRMRALAVGSSARGARRVRTLVDAERCRGRRDDARGVVSSCSSRRELSVTAPDAEA